MAPDLLSTIRLEVDERLSELRPLLDEHKQLLAAADALETTGGEDGSDANARTTVSATRPRRGTRIRTAPIASPPATAKPKAVRAARGAAREAILAALDHGSHTVGELVVVTATSGPNVNGNVRRLVSEGLVVKTEREGKTAWALPGATS